MVAASQSETELAKAFRKPIIRAQSRRHPPDARTLYCRASGRPPPADIDLALDLVFGLLFYRLLMGHARITRGFVDQLLDAVVPARAGAVPRFSDLVLGRAP